MTTRFIHIHIFRFIHTVYPHLGRCLKLVLSNKDILVMVGMLLLLYDYRLFCNEKNKIIQLETETWWGYPLQNMDLSVKGGVPRLADDQEPWAARVGNRSLEQIQFPSRKRTRSEKTIVFHHSPMESVDYDVDSKSCGGQCRVKIGKEFFDTADALIFSTPFPTNLPQRYFPEQLFVWFLLESPSRTSFLSRELNVLDGFKSYDGIFNLTMNYRRDADIYFPYNTSYNIRNSIEAISLDKLLAGKSKFSAWVASNCQFTKGSATRMKIVINLLALGLDIDMFGYCVGKLLPGSWVDMPKYLKPYKFYFSFENALHCRDYITEKTWLSALGAGVVPVIWGPRKIDLEGVLPRNSYIHVEDFQNENDLVRYLISLNEDDEKYLEFFKWRFEEAKNDVRKRNNLEQPWVKPESVGLCQLCQLLHGDEKHEKEFGSRPKRIVWSIYDWWYFEETRTCLTSYSKKDRAFSSYLNRRLRRHLRYKHWSTRKQSIYVVVNVFIVLFVLFHRFRYHFGARNF